MNNEVRAPADDLADGRMYLGLAEDIENIIADLKIQYQATRDRGTYYRI